MEQKIINSIKELLSKHLENIFMLIKELTNERQFLTRKDVARLIGISLSTVDYWARTGKITKHYVGTSVRFSRSEILSKFKIHKNEK